jgi:hypothetical protein
MVGQIWKPIDKLGLETTLRRKSLRNRAAKASEMAAREIDRLSKRRIYRPGVFDGRTDGRNNITIYDPKADGTYLGPISDCGWPSASRNA